MFSRLMMSITAVFAISVPAGASAQNNQLSVGGELMTSISTTEFVAFMLESGVAAREVERADDTITFELSIPTAPEAGVLYTALRSCNMAVAPARCELVQYFGFFSAAGVLFDQVNDFNVNRSNIAMAGLMDGGNGVIASKSYLQGGVTKLHFAVETALFFQDVDLISAAIRPGAIASVDYERALSVNFSHGGDNGFDLPAGVDYRVNSVGANARRLMPDPLRKILAD